MQSRSCAASNCRPGGRAGSPTSGRLFELHDVVGFGTSRHVVPLDRLGLLWGFMGCADEQTPMNPQVLIIERVYANYPRSNRFFMCLRVLICA